MAEWLGVTIEKKSVVDAKQGRVTIEWKMNGRLDQDWIKAFDSATQTRSGTLDFLHGPGPVASGTSVRWSVPDASVEAASMEVDRRVATANERFVAVLERRAAGRAQKDELERAKRQQIADAQARLNNI
jgi:hypothetical protein